MSSDDAFLDAAATIGRGIAAKAVWHGGRCNWVGAVAGHDGWRPEYRALDASLYEGTAGVGMFLVELAVATGDPAFRRTAVGAMRQAVAQAPASPGDGFHTGSLGIAWAAARAAAVLDDDELRAGSHHLLVAARPRPDGCPDVMAGSAGSILARLALDALLDDPRLRDEAVTTGADLLARATVGEHGWSWGPPGRHHLCGLPHGAGGIGWALLELFAVTGDERFREAAEGAFAYERSWLDEESGTWPDLRIGGQRRGSRRRIPSPAVGSWCHGEAGIALSRLRAIEILGPAPYADEARIALDTTRRYLASALPHEIDDLTLCHGASGSADALMCGGARDPSLALGRLALERYGEGGAGWPCGVPGGTTPSLFQGLSGIGWWLLRLHDTDIPSPLTLPVRLTAVCSPA